LAIDRLPPAAGLAVFARVFGPLQGLVAILKRVRRDCLAIVRYINLDAGGNETNEAGHLASFLAQRPQTGARIVHGEG
jgi:hypothetical protein